MDSARYGDLLSLFDAVVSDYVGDSMNEEIFADNVFDECEVHHNCTVEIWRNSKTGKISIGWYENKDERKND